MTDEIIELLPSDDLKAVIKEKKHQFSDDELLQIIYSYAPTFDARLELLERFSAVASPNVSALAKAYIKYEQDNFKRFTEESEGFVYELCIKDTPESYEEKYICSSYHAALVCIDRFYEEYSSINVKETSETRYRILKRRIFSDNDKFDEDEYAECVLGTNKNVLKISDYRNPADCETDTDCSECNEICPYRKTDVNYPCFAHHLDIIKYCDHEGKICYGIKLCGGYKCDGMELELYIIPFESSALREHRYDDELNYHVHVDAPLATIATIADIDETSRENYFAFIEFLKSNKHKYIRTELANCPRN